jgi:hypothetical protein
MSKPGVDWTAIEARVRAGESFRSIADKLTEAGTPISHVAISKRANKEGWKKGNDWSKAVTKSVATLTGQPQGEVKPNQPVLFNKDTPAARAQILQDLSLGLPYKSAAERAGISEATLGRWREADDDFAGQCNAAVRAFEAKHVANIDSAADRGDWKAAAWRLERHPATRADYGQDDKRGGGPQFVVVLNIPRAGDNPPTIEADYAEVSNG